MNYYKQRVEMLVLVCRIRVVPFFFVRRVWHELPHILIANIHHLSICLKAKNKFNLDKLFCDLNFISDLKKSFCFYLIKLFIHVQFQTKYCFQWFQFVIIKNCKLIIHKSSEFIGLLIYRIRYRFDSNFGLN